MHVAARIELDVGRRVCSFTHLWNLHGFVVPKRWRRIVPFLASKAAPNGRWDRKWKERQSVASKRFSSLKKSLSLSTLKKRAVAKVSGVFTADGASTSFVDHDEDGSPQSTPPDTPKRQSKQLSSRTMNAKLTQYNANERHLELIIKLQRMVRRDIVRKRLLSLIYGV